MPEPRAGLGAPETDGSTHDTARLIEETDDMWGRRTIDVNVLLDHLAEATRAVYAASIAAQWRNEAGFPIASRWADLLGGLSQVIDAVIDEFQTYEEID